MKITIEEHSVTMEAETPHEQQALVKLRGRDITVSPADPWGPKEDKVTKFTIPKHPWD